MDSFARLRDLIRSLLARAATPCGSIVFLHVRLRGLRDLFQLDYHLLTECILKTVDEQLAPKTILVPTYTNASFRYTGIFHTTFSRSEVGRFSEEVRTRFCGFRTPDPIYSIADTGSFLAALTGIDYRRTYGPGSLFDELNSGGYIVVNLGLDYLVATQLHAAERLAHVPYRFERDVTGIVYFNEHEWQNVTYHTYLLDSSGIGVTYPAWDRPRIEALLLEHQVLHLSSCGPTRLAWFESTELTDFMTPLLIREPSLLLETAAT
ncbi:MAG TPA: AAC(3) family N-acetyltransferase [Acidimicrobiales bacterium]|jgi:aminoglycoside N3'-acetyltransferase|nr:AAC(3) family N-acetyltransferase [Acidimicrobiales bacterium]